MQTTRLSLGVFKSDCNSIVCWLPTADVHPSTICASSTVMTHACGIRKTTACSEYFCVHMRMPYPHLETGKRTIYRNSDYLFRDHIVRYLSCPITRGSREPLWAPYSTGLFHSNVIFCEVSRTVKYQIITSMCIATITDNTNIHSISLLIFSLRSFYSYNISFIPCILLFKRSCHSEATCGSTIYYAHAILWKSFRP
jgi:hypothetical protein